MEGMSNQARTPAGTPAGGQFAATERAEASDALSASADLPEWGELLDDEFNIQAGEHVDQLWNDMTAGWTKGMYRSSDAPMLEVLRMSEEDVEATYGPERAAWLGSLRFRAVPGRHYGGSSQPQGAPAWPMLRVCQAAGEADTGVVLAEVEYDEETQSFHFESLTDLYPGPT